MLNWIVLSFINLFFFSLFYWKKKREKKAVALWKNKYHLSAEGKLELITIWKEMKKEIEAPTSKDLNFVPLSIYWLGGFTSTSRDGDGSFSISNYLPRLKYENHIKEKNLYSRIKNLLGTSSNILVSNPRKDRPNASTTVYLDITVRKGDNLKNKIAPLFADTLKSKKLKDYKEWCIILEIYYLGYHLVPALKGSITNQ